MAADRGPESGEPGNMDVSSRVMCPHLVPASNSVSGCRQGAVCMLLPFERRRVTCQQACKDREECSVKRCLTSCYTWPVTTFHALLATQASECHAQAPTYRNTKSNTERQ